MKSFGKTIKIFLVDGDPNGRMTCELSNWTGKALKIPRKKIKDSIDRPELENTGVYILFGRSDKSESKDKAYIGEAEGIYKRLMQHLSAKDFWNEAIVLVSKDENLNKAHIKYLESRLYEMKARGQSTNEGFVVLKDSEVASSITNSFPKNWITLREGLINEGVIERANGKLIFSKDYLFTSPSAAAAIVMGRSANGLTEWKLSDGRILKAVELN